MLGRELKTIAPVAFLPRGHALSIAVFSYNGLISFGLLGDYDRMYDLDVIAQGIGESLAELAQPAGAPRVDGHRRRSRPRSEREPSRKS